MQVGNRHNSTQKSNTNSGPHVKKLVVWMITYNHAAYIAQAIDSVLMQKCNFQFHLYIGVDLSSDATLDICIKYEKLYPNRITVLKADQRIGPAKNALRVYRTCVESGATYMAMLEGDDYWYSNSKLQEQVDILDNSETITVVTSRYISDDTNTGRKSLQPIAANCRKGNFIFTRKENMLKWYTKTCTVCLRISSIDINKLSKYKFLCDFIILYQALSHGDGFFINTPTAVYRLHEQGTWTSKSDLEKSKTTYLIHKELFINENSDPFLRDILMTKIKIYIRNSSLSTNPYYPFEKELLLAPLYHFLASDSLKHSLLLYKNIFRRILSE